MNVAEIRNLYSTEFMSFSPDYETVHVYELDGGSKHIDVKLVIALNKVRNGARPRKRKR